MPALTPLEDFIDKFHRTFRRLATDNQHEREAVAHALFRLCTSDGVPLGMSIVDLAELVKNAMLEKNLDAVERKYTDEDLKITFERGRAKGRAETSQQSLNATYFDDNGNPRWQEIARYCYEHSAFSTLRDNEQDIVEQTLMTGRVRSARAGGFMLSVWFGLGGRFT